MARRIEIHNEQAQTSIYGRVDVTGREPADQTVGQQRQEHDEAWASAEAQLQTAMLEYDQMITDDSQQNSARKLPG